MDESSGNRLEVQDQVQAGVALGKPYDGRPKAFYSIDVHLPSFWWVERVPSKSNPSDEPSSFEGRAAASLWNARSLQGFKCQTKIAEWLIKAASLRRLVDCRGKWKPIRASKTAKISNRSKPMDQMTYPQSRYLMFPRSKKKRSCAAGCLNFDIVHWMITACC